MAAPAVFDARGARVSLAAKLGEGGEGTIYEAALVGSWVAKLYKAPLPPEKIAKLEAMAACRTERLLSIAAWPIGTLHAAPGGPAVGFLMPRGQGCDIHLLYSPKSRFANFPDTAWDFLLHAAVNLARAFAVVHALRAIATGRLPPTAGCAALDPRCALPVVREMTERRIDSALAWASDEGRKHAALMLWRAPEDGA